MNALALLLALPTTTSAPALPDDALFALHLTGGEALQARLEDNTWLRVGLAAAEEALGGEQAEIGLPSLLECAGAIESVAAFISADTTTMGVFVVENDAGLYSDALAKIREALENEVGPGVEHGSLVAYDVEGLGWESVDGEATQLVLIQADDLVGATLCGEGGDALAAARAALAGEGGTPSGLDVRGDLPGAQLAIHVDIQRLMVLALEDDRGDEVADMIADLFSGFREAGMAMRFGVAGAVDGIARVSFDEDSLWGDLAGMCSPYDPELLRWAPAGSPTVQVMGFDVGAFVEELLAVFADMNDEAAQGIEEGLAMAEEQLGMDVLADLIAYLDSGIVTYFTETPDFELMEDDDYLPGLGYIFGSSDAEALEENLVSVVETFGMMAMVQVDEHAGGRLYTAPDLGLSMGFVAGEGVFGFLMGDDAIDHAVGVLKGEAPKSVLDDEDMREAIARSRGAAGFSYLDASVLRSMFEMIEAETGGSTELTELLDGVDGTIEFTNEVDATSVTLRGRVR